MINLNNQSKVLIGQAKNIMKKLMPLLDKNTKQSKPNPELSKSFLRPSKSEVFLTKKHKKSTSPDIKKPQVSKNDQRITIYTDPTGFIVQYSILYYGLKCDCYVTESSTKRNSKGLKLQSIQPRQNFAKKKVKLEITLSKHHITTIKNGVQHIFSLPQQSKLNFLKVVLTQNWQIQLFTIPNKKTKISQFDSTSISQKDLDSVYPLKNIIETDELRKNKLIKSDSKLKISWGNPQRQTDENSSFDLNKSEILTFKSEKVLGEMSRSTIIEGSKQFPRSAFVKKSWHQCDQTRDSEEDQFGQEKYLQKKVGHTEAKLSKSIHIDLSKWNYSPLITESIKSPYRETNFQYRILGDKLSECKYFK